jgi:hypothetical protein
MLARIAQGIQPRERVRNPESGRYILIGGKTHKAMLAKQLVVV